MTQECRAISRAKRVYSEYCLKSVVMPPKKKVPEGKLSAPKMCSALCSNEVEKDEVANARGQFTGTVLVCPWMSFRALMVPTHTCHVCMSQRWLK